MRILLLHDFFADSILERDYVLTNSKNSRIVTVMKIGSTRYEKLWDAETGAFLWGQMQDRVSNHPSILPDFSPDGNYIGFHDGVSIFRILKINTIPVEIASEINVGNLSAKISKFALGRDGSSISVLKSKSNDVRKYTKNENVHVFATPGDVFGRHDDRRCIRYSTDGSQVFLIRFSKPNSTLLWQTRDPSLIIDAYDFSSASWRAASRSVVIPGTILEMRLLGAVKLLGSQNLSRLAIEFEESTRETQGRFVAFVALEVDNTCFMLSSDHDTFVSHGRILLVSKKKEPEKGIYIETWDGVQDHGFERIHSIPISCFRYHCTAIAFNYKQLVLLMKK